MPPILPIRAEGVLRAGGALLILGVVLFGVVLLALWPHEAAAQGWGVVEGRVTEAGTEAPVPAATVLVAGTNFGTSADAEGRYRLRLPAGAYVLRFSSIGFTARTDSVALRRGQTVELDAALESSVTELEGVEVTDDEDETPDAGVFEIDPEDVKNMPTPLPDGFRALKALPGVATNNELSSQYSVRGGGYNENLIFINGFEVYMPFRPRQGEQEGLGLWNPQLTESARLYAGGFPARFGGKLSSALEVEYERPEDQALSGAVNASLMDVSAQAGASAFGNRLGWNVGVRKARADRLFGSQELKGDYQPDYTDVQGVLSYRLADGHEVEALGIWADHEFSLQPQAKRTYFGILSLDPERPSDLQSLYTQYDGSETDGYATRFLGGRLKDRLSGSFRMEHEAAFFQTEETEELQIGGSSVLTQVDPASGEATGVLGVGEQRESADNRVRVSTLTGRGRYYLTRGRHAPEAGWHLRRLRFSDRIDEQALHIIPRTEDTTIVSSFSDGADLGTWQAGAYVQDVYDVLPERDRLLLTAGLRGDYYAFNDELTLSPRLSARFEWTEQTTLNASLGLYHQKPTYRELRGEPPTAALVDSLGSFENTLNRDLESQRAVELIVGGEHFFPDRRLYLRAEAYYKDLSNLITYDIDNVRVEYSGENDASGYTYGLDLQLRGEFVPGLESWFNYSFLVSREDFYEEFENEQNDYLDGAIARPADQRHTFSAFVQDYVPGDKTWKLHMRALFGSGLPYTPPVPGQQISNQVVSQQPGPRDDGRYPSYRRVDVGATKLVRLFDEAISGPMTLRLTAEILNLFDMTNTVAYQWDSEFNRIPTHLTPRTINVRMRLNF